MLVDVVGLITSVSDAVQASSATRQDKRHIRVTDGRYGAGCVCSYSDVGCGDVSLVNCMRLAVSRPLLLSGVSMHLLLTRMA